MSHDASRPAMATPTPISEPRWKILVVDPDPTLADTARRVIGDHRLNGLGVEIASAGTAAEAKVMLDRMPGVAVVLLEAVLETETAGLELVTYIRKELGNSRVRIIVATAHPDRVPEHQVVEEHDISDYRTKDGLVPAAVRTLLIGRLRAFSALQALSDSRREFARMLLATSGLVELRTPDVLFANLLPRVIGLLGRRKDALLCVLGDTVPRDKKMRVRAATGRFAKAIGQDVATIGEPLVVATFERLGPSSETIVDPTFCALRLRAHAGITGMIYVEGRTEGTAREWQLLELFRNKASIALENALLVDELNGSQKATVLAMGALAEYKDNAATGHLLRMERLVGDMAQELLARNVFPDELDEDLADKLGLACILHDVGMSSVSDETLGVPGELAEEDMQLIYRHTEIGHRILSDAAAPLRGRNLLSIAAEIARFHHERYDGSGYLEGLKGQAIPIGARITAVADVFDALITERHKREALSIDDALAWMDARAGTDFDPEVVKSLRAVVRRIAETEPEWFPKPEDAPNPMLFSAIGRKLRGLFGRISEPAG